ncbi:hypothetical protein C7C46_13460 [Streptomyces tateyamensis]|uniref:Aspartate ammonia-lyase n=1 Tax=Streptomyces tateyamensis TaxID=565073 RepID=A0A2V4N7A2_9ACTN|nr:DUF4139 domain-containing protein [Streptomyces tateyamensis]PYC79957.1 hypothetical protein C7C46_13460 [Streptomyces tateyamensis]
MTTQTATPVPATPAPVPLPVTAATCLEDRAHLERTATLALPAGTTRLLLGPLSPLAVDHTLRTALSDPTVRVLDARLARSWTPPRPGPPAPEASELRHRLHQLATAKRAFEAEQHRLTARLALLDQLTAELLREVGEGTGFDQPEPQRWQAELARVEADQDAATERLQQVRFELAEVGKREREASVALEQAEREPTELLAHLELTVQAEQPTNCELTVRHLTACALWRPAYRARFADGELRLEADAVVWQATGEDWSGVRLTFSTARSALATAPPLLREDRLQLRELSAEERRTVEVDLREEDIAVAEAALGALAPAELPGVDDGGEVQVLSAPAPANVPADGRAHRIPLGAFQVPAGAERIAVPELSPVVGELVSFRNPADHPLLAGPVELVRDSGYLGRGQLRFTAAGARAELSFPGSDDYRLHREVEEHRTSTGLAGLGQRSVITRTVRVHVSRLTPPEEAGEQSITLRERIPVSELAAVEVRLRESACDPRPDEVDAEGVVRWELALAPNSRRTVTFVYELTATAKVAGL